MNKLSKAVKIFGKKTSSKVKSNRSIIFTAVEVVGVGIVTAISYFTGKRIERKIQELKDENPEISRRDIFKNVWLDLLPMFGSATGLVTVIVLNERMSQKEKAELISTIAFGAGSIEMKRRQADKDIPEQSTSELVDKTYWIFPNPGEAEFADGLVADDANLTLCCDEFSGRYFWQTEENVRNAIKEYIDNLNELEECAYNEFYSSLGIYGSQMGEEFGDVVCIRSDGTEGKNDCGNINMTTPIFTLEHANTVDGQPVLVISRPQIPMQNWYEF